MTFLAKDEFWGKEQDLKEWCYAHPDEETELKNPSQMMRGWDSSAVYCAQSNLLACS